jgi:hypothetical protein
MAISDEQLIQEIKDEVQGEDLEVKVDTWWGHYADIYTGNFPLIYAYTRWKILNLLLIKYRTAVDYTTGSDKIAASQLYKNLLSSVSDARANVDRLDPEINPDSNKTAVSSTMAHNTKSSSSENRACWRKTRCLD